MFFRKRCPSRFNQNKEKGKLIKQNFKYSSDNNSKKISSSDLKKFIHKNVDTIR